MAKEDLVVAGVGGGVECHLADWPCCATGCFSMVAALSVLLTVQVQLAVRFKESFSSSIKASLKLLIPYSSFNLSTISFVISTSP